MEKSNLMRLSKISLGALLVLQLAITLNLYWNNQQQRKAISETHALFDIDATQVDKVVINDGSTSVMLHKTAKGWLLAEAGGLPANGAKVDTVVKTITALTPSWPIATTTSSQQQLEVAADNFQRRVQLYSGDQEVGELLLGTSPGFKQAHARRSDSEAIYSVGISNHELPASTKEWLDKSLLRAVDVTTIQGPDFSLEKQGEQWRFDSATAQEIGNSEIDGDKATQLAAALGSLSVLDIATAPTEGNHLELSVSSEEGDWSYRFTQADNQYYVSRNDHDEVFTISQFDYERIANIDRPQLALKTKKEEQGEETGEQAANASDTEDVKVESPEAEASAVEPSTVTSEHAVETNESSEPADKGKGADTAQDSEAANS